MQRKHLKQLLSTTNDLMWIDRDDKSTDRERSIVSNNTTAQHSTTTV